jgi:hypothetical protein
MRDLAKVGLGLLPGAGRLDPEPLADADPLPFSAPIGTINLHKHLRSSMKKGPERSAPGPIP